MPRKKSSGRPRVTRVSIRAERHPEPDWDRFAWALLQHVKRLSSTDPNKRGRQRRTKP